MENNEYFASINDVSKRLNVPAHTLRYWEKQFPVAIKPTTGAGGRRYYRTETVNRLIIIKDLLYTRGMTIAGVKKMMRDGVFPDDASAPLATAPVVAPKPDAQPHTVASTSEISDVIDMLMDAKQILTVG